MLNIKDKLTINEPDLQIFINQWFKNADDKTITKKNLYRFNLRNDIIAVTFLTTGKKLYYVKMKQSFKDYPTYHSYNQNIVFDTELFFMENCKITQKKLEGRK